MPTRGPPRPRRGAIEELAVAFVAIAVTTLRDGMRMDAVAMAIGDRATAMPDCPVATRVIEAAQSWNRGAVHAAKRSVHLSASSCCALATTGSDQHDIASLLHAVQFTSRAVQWSLHAVRWVVPSCRFASPSAAIGVTGVSNESDGVGDSVCSVTDALIVADDRRDKRERRRSVVHDRVFAQSSNPIVRSDPLFDASDPLIVLHGSLNASADRLASVAASG